MRLVGARVLEAPTEKPLRFLVSTSIDIRHSQVGGWAAGEMSAYAGVREPVIPLHDG